MLKKIFFIIISLSAIFLIPTYKVSAYTLVDHDFEDLYYTINNDSKCNNGVVIINDNDTIRAYCGVAPFYNGYISNLSNVGISKDLDRNTNFYTISKFTSFYSYDSTNTNRRISAMYTFDISNQSWSLTCTNATQPFCDLFYNISSDAVVLAYLQLTNTYNGSGFVYNWQQNQFIFPLGYDLRYYNSVLDSWSESTYNGYLTWSDIDSVTGSSEDYTSNDKETTDLSSISPYWSYNHNMFLVEDISSNVALLGVNFHYLFNSNVNNKLGFVLTYKTIQEVTPIVIAKTDIGSYSCTETALNTYNDITYQWYVECPSVAFGTANDSYLDIIVQGSYDTTIPLQASPLYFKQPLFYTDTGVVGISSILYKTTDTPPTPITPDTPSDSTIIDSIDDMNNNIMDTSGPDTSKLNNSAGWLPPGPVDSIINLPLNMFNSLASVLNNNLCTPVVLPLPFLTNSTISLPCINTLINSMGFGTFWSWVGGIVSGIILYNYLIRYYKWIDNTLTFRENNWNDWGGI